RVARPGAPGADRDPGLTHVRGQSAADIELDLIQAMLQFPAVGPVSLMMGADCAGHDIGGPQERLLAPGYVHDVEACPFRECEPSSADRGDVTSVELSRTGFDHQV